MSLWQRLRDRCCCCPKRQIRSTVVEVGTEESSMAAPGACTHLSADASAISQSPFLADVQRFEPNVRSEGQDIPSPRGTSNSFGLQKDNSDNFYSFASFHLDSIQSTGDAEEARATQRSDEQTLDTALRGLSEREQSVMRMLVPPVLQEDGWEVHSSSAAALVCKQMRVGGAPGQERPLLMWRMRTLLRNTTPRKVFELLMDSEKQHTWNTYVKASSCISNEYGVSLLQTYFKGVGPVSAREALEFRAASTRLEDPVLWIAFTSTGTETLGIPEVPKHTRVFTNTSGYCISVGAEPGTVSFTLLTLADAGGSIPDWIVRQAGSKAPTDFAKLLQSALDKL